MYCFTIGVKIGAAFALVGLTTVTAATGMTSLALINLTGLATLVQWLLADFDDDLEEENDCE